MMRKNELVRFISGLEKQRTEAADEKLKADLTAIIRTAKWILNYDDVTRDFLKNEFGTNQEARP